MLILDEPMSGLDPKARILVKRQLAAERDAGRTVFLTTHMLIDVQALCDQIAILHGGRTVFRGPPKLVRHIMVAKIWRALFLTASKPSPLKSVKGHIHARVLSHKLLSNALSVHGANTSFNNSGWKRLSQALAAWTSRTPVPNKATTIGCSL